MTTPIRIGMMRNIPFPQMLNTMMVIRATSARNQFVWALLMAEPARDRPMQMMTGPVTTGGRKRMTRFTPTSLMMSARTRYRSPATMMPPQA